MFEPLGREWLEDPDRIEREVLEGWKKDDLLAATLAARAEGEPFVFYEGPPTANGLPGIHHVLARALKDAVCRYQTMRGRRVLRKAGWDTHGLPVEIEVEKKLGIEGKEGIEAHGIGPFNQACRESVFEYREEWEKLSRRIGFLLDYERPYVTCEPDYIETVWFLLSRFSAAGLLERGHKVLPWCGRCGTGLSSHEVGQGFKDVEDPSVWVTFPLLDAPGELAGAALVAWTTTPWTLPSNMAACVHPDFEYALAQSGDDKFILLEDKVAETLGEDAEVVGKVAGKDLAGLAYTPLFEIDGADVVQEGDRVHQVVADPFVGEDEGTGIVHLAPYGEDDFRIARREGIRVAMTVGDQGRFTCPAGPVEEGTFFKEANLALCRDLESRGRMVRRISTLHSYPHCWRCDTPLLYKPSPAWFLRTTDYAEAMVEENAMIEWAPPELGSARFGEWLEGNVDWALSRDRYWGTPIPVWECGADPDHWDCLGSFAELAERVGGLAEDFDPHRPGIDALTFPCSREGCPGTMTRVPQVVDCWFDSGAMPFAQYHWPFENRATVAEQFPADFICEGLDQTRGWFYTLHAIAVFLTRVDAGLWESGELEGAPLPRLEPGGAYRSVLVNGLLLDDQGRKMSKRLANLVDPWAAFADHGVDAVRWALLGGGSTHLSRRWSDDGIREIRRRILGTLTSCYDFLSLYAGTESWTPPKVPSSMGNRPAMDRWMLSRAAAAAEEMGEAWEALDPPRALRALEKLVVEELSNWYIRRSRRRFWSGGNDAAFAFSTLHEVLGMVARMAAPATPFLAESLWGRLGESGSVHLAAFPDPSLPDTGFQPDSRDLALETAMDGVVRASTLGRAVRERTRIRVRQPLQKVLVHIAGASPEDGGARPQDYEDALREELNVKEVEWVEGTPDFLEVRGKANFRALGPRAGKNMKALAAAIAGLDREALFRIQGGEEVKVDLEGAPFTLGPGDVEVEALGVEGLEAASDGKVTLGLEVEITPELACEGLAREILNRVQTQRREAGLDLSDRIRLQVFGDDDLRDAVSTHGAWIGEEALAPGGVKWAKSSDEGGFRAWEIPGEKEIHILLEKVNPSPNPC